MTKTENMQQNEDSRAPGFFQMAGSILRSFYGVQNAKSRERDFKYGKATHFIAIGVLMTALWYGSIWLVVKLVLHFLTGASA